MPKTNLLKFVFNALLIVSLVLVVISLVTPAWRIYQFHKSQASFGLLTSDCYDYNHYNETENQAIVSSNGIVATRPTVGTGNTVVEASALETDATVKRNMCNQFPVVQRNYEKATTVLIILSIISLIFAILSSCILQRMMPRFYWISPMLTLMATIFLLISIFIYSINADKYLLPLFASNTVISSNTNNVENVLVASRENYLPYNFGYSFWLAFAALITTLIAAIIGFMASKNFGDEHSSRLLVQSYITSATK